MESYLPEIGFIDRDTIRKDFMKYYNDFKIKFEENQKENKKENKKEDKNEDKKEDNKNKANQYKAVLNYYGYGGVGKSTLMQEIKKDLQAKHCLVINYDLEPSGSVTNSIFCMKQLLVRECGFEFPIMDLAQYVYLCIIGENPVFPKAQSHIEKNPRLRICFGLFGGLPIIGPLFQSVQAWDEVYAIMKDETNQLQIQQLRNSGPLDLDNRLRDLFIEELNDNLEKVKKPLVVIFDRFESLKNKRDAGIVFRDKDRLICGTGGLIKRVPNVLWVFAGREKLELDGKLKEYLSLCPVNGLDYDYTHEFLQNGNIPENFHEELYRLTGGVPAFLNLCVEFAKNPDTDELTIDGFGNTRDEMVDRFFDHLTDNQADLLSMLSCLDTWTDDMVMDVGPKVLEVIVDSSYEKIKKLCFIKYDEAVQRYSMDNVIRRTMFLRAIKVCPTLIVRTLKYAIKYVKKNNDFENLKVLMELALKDNESDKELKTKLLDDTKLLKFYKKYFKDYLFDRSRMGLKVEVNTIFYDFYQRAMKSENKELQIYAYYSHSFFLLNSGKYKDAYETGKQALELCKKELKEKDSLRLEVESNYSECLRRVGEVNRALELAKKVCEKRRAKAGERDRDTLDSKNDYAVLLSEAGNDEEALKLGEEVYYKQVEEFGEDNPDTLRYMSNMAVYLSGLGKEKEALDWGEKTFIKRKEILGKKHPDTLLSMYNIAFFLAALGKTDEAVKLAREVVQKRTEVLGEYHPATILSMIQLSEFLSMYCEFDKDMEAVKWDRKVVNRRIETLGNCDKDTLWSMAVLSTDLVRICDYKEATDWDRKVLKGRKEVLGEEHPDTIQAMVNLSAHLFLYDVDDEESKKLADEVLEKREALLAEQRVKLGTKDPATCRTMNDLATYYASKHEYKKAVKLEEELLNVKIEDLGENHPETIQAKTSVIRNLFEAGEEEKALKLEKELLSKMKTNLGEAHPDVLHRMRELSSHYFTARKYKESVKLYEELLAIRERLSGKDDPATLEVMLDLAYSLDALAQTEKFAESDMKALADRKELLGRDLPEMFRTMRELARKFRDLGRYLDAEPLDSRVLNRLKKLLGEDHPEVLQSKEDLANDLSGSEKFGEAVELDREIVDRKKALLREKGLSWEKDEDTLQAMRNLAFDLSGLDEHEEAYKWDKIVYEKRKELLGEDHPDTLESMQDMDIDLSNFSKNKEAESSFTEPV